MADAKKPEVRKEDLADARHRWDNFTELMKWSVIAILAILVLMVLFLY
jgi:hypothetical protein